jgi:hypothetical protein
LGSPDKRVAWQVVVGVVILCILANNPVTSGIIMRVEPALEPHTDKTSNLVTGASIAVRGPAEVAWSMCGPDMGLHVALRGAFIVAVVTAEPRDLFKERDRRRVVGS